MKSKTNSKATFWEWAILRTGHSAALRLQETGLDPREMDHCLILVEIAQDVARCLQARGVDPVEIGLADAPPAPSPHANVNGR
jgi:hypothetical protein